MKILQLSPINAQSCRHASLPVDSIALAVLTSSVTKLVDQWQCEVFFIFIFLASGFDSRSSRCILRSRIEMLHFQGIT